MNDFPLHAALLTLVIALVTIALRFLPFLLFSGKRKPPAFVVYLGKVLPFAIMGMLVVYCLRSVNVRSFPFGLPELISGVLVAGLHVWKRSAVLSIIGGTACYMLLKAFVFH